MNYQDFCENVKHIVQSSLGADYNISLVKSNKLNGLTLVSLVILKKEEAMASNIYLEAFYSEYQISGHLPSIAEKIISLYQTADKNLRIPGNLLLEFHSAKDRLYCKLINYEKNRTLLSNVPHVRWFDLAIIFCILVKKDCEGIAFITVNNGLMERWTVTVDAIYSKALENTPHLFEASVQPMEDIIRGIINDKHPSSGSSMDEIIPDILSDYSSSGKISPMYVAGNTYGLGGAAWLLQRDELRTLSRKLNTSLYILPSSIHELIIIPYSDRISKNDLLTMVQEVNSTQVATDEFLADNVYLYTRKDDAILPLF